MANKNHTSEKDKNAARRRILKRLVAGGGIVATGKMMPDGWNKPVVESVILPAHAQTSPDGDPMPDPNTVPNNSAFLLSDTDLPIV